MKLEGRKRKQTLRSQDAAGLEAQRPEPFFDLQRDVPKEDVRAWEELVDKGDRGTSWIDRITIFNSAKLLDLIPDQREEYRNYPWVKVRWIEYFKEFFKTMDYQSAPARETAEAYEQAAVFLRVFPEARAELLASRDEEKDYRLLLESIAQHPFNFSVVPTMLQLWPERRAEILQQVDIPVMLKEATKYGQVWRAAPFALVYPEYKDEVRQAVLAEGEWKGELEVRQKEAREKYYNIPNYYNTIQGLVILAADEANIDDQGKLHIIMRKGRLAEHPKLPDRSQV